MFKASIWRTATTLAVAGASILAGGTAASAATISSPEAVAAAAYPPYFEIYYGPNCASASRVYTGVNRGEAWINDTFNNTETGTAGYGQKIRNNAASIRTWNVQSVNIKGNDGTYIAFSSQGACVPLDSRFGNRRNNNIGWQTVPLGGFSN
ncbi:hypothetical protein [Clavibacter michiganensis]|uniref:hypothetical protein n=1 Tax=Clavibacter michiganensis TaxID=28447 RepID=UPI0029312A69|nr:hypothetical protein [Clavibacter michiganensis]